MKLSRLYIFLAISFLPWLGLSYLLLFYGEHQDHWLKLTGLIIGGFFITTGVFLLGFTFYLMNNVVPKIALIVDPVIHNLIVNNKETGFFKFHWLTTYGLCIVSRRMNQRIIRRGDMPAYDFRQLPRELKIPIIVQFYWLTVGFLGALMGFGLLKLGAHFGYYQFSDF